MNGMLAASAAAMARPERIEIAWRRGNEHWRRAEFESQRQRVLVEAENEVRAGRGAYSQLVRDWLSRR